MPWYAGSLTGFIGTSKWNRSIDIVISYTCIFLALTSPNVWYERNLYRLGQVHYVIMFHHRRIKERQHNLLLRNTVWSVEQPSINQFYRAPELSKIITTGVFSSSTFSKTLPYHHKKVSNCWTSSTIDIIRNELINKWTIKLQPRNTPHVKKWYNSSYLLYTILYYQHLQHHTTSFLTFMLSLGQFWQQELTKNEV